MLQRDLQEDIENYKEKGLYRKIKYSLSSPQSSNVLVNEHRYLSFCSNDYLGLANHPLVKRSYIEGIIKYGAGSGSSHLIIGHSKAHLDLEVALSDFTNRDRVILFSSGYAANIGVITALINKNDIIFEDKLNHASLIDGGLMSKARFHRYIHNDMESLRRKIQHSNARRRMIISDGVFSMDGDIAKLDELVEISKEYHSYLMIDDAHGFGFLGKQGGGISEYFNKNQEDLPVLIGTFGKSFGTSGAFVAGSHELIEYLTNFARTYIYTTALPAAVAFATLTSLDILQKESWRRNHLSNLIHSFQEGCKKYDLNILESSTPIQSIIIGDCHKLMHISTLLKNQGILVSAIRPPTVPIKTSRLRISLTANHTKDDVEQLLILLRKTIMICE